MYDNRRVNRFGRFPNQLLNYCPSAVKRTCRNNNILSTVYAYNENLRVWTGFVGI